MFCKKEVSNERHWRINLFSTMTERQTDQAWTSKERKNWLHEYFFAKMISKLTNISTLQLQIRQRIQHKGNKPMVASQA